MSVYTKPKKCKWLNVYNVKRKVFQNYCNVLVENDKMNMPNSEKLFQDIIALSIMENTSIDKLDKIIKSIKNML